MASGQTRAIVVRVSLEPTATLGVAWRFLGGHLARQAPLANVIELAVTPQPR